MTKLKLAALAGVGALLLNALTTLAMAGSIGFGVSGTAMYITAEGKETLKTTSSVDRVTHTGYSWMPDLYAQYTFGDDGFVIGYQNDLQDMQLGDELRNTADHLAIEKNTAGAQHVKAALSGHQAIYVETPGLGPDGGLYLKAAYGDATILTQEDLLTGSSYPDADVNFTQVGLGWKAGAGSGFLFKIEGSYTDYDSISIKSTGSDAETTIDADPETYNMKVSIGYNF